MFSLVHSALELSSLGRPDAGGYASFVGRVRDHHVGRAVVGLEYEAFEAMALAEGRRVLEEAERRFGICEARCQHRLGSLEVGDPAIVVEVAAAHRREAFRACEFIVDEVKKRVPIWKRERYADGVEEWVHAWSSPPETLTEDKYYSAQTRMAEIGPEGQEKLRSARVLVVGAGGLGCPAITYLASCGVGTLGVADGDLLEPSNLHRQPLFRAADIGRPKADLATEAVAALNPYVRVEPMATRVNEANADAILSRYDVVLDGTDNFETKYLLNDRCVALGLPLVAAGIYRMEGWVASVIPNAQGGCLRCLWPEHPEGVRSCAEVGVLGFVPAVFGVLQAAEAVKLLLGLGDSLANSLWMVDLLSMQARNLGRARSPECDTCNPGIEPAQPPTPARFDLPWDHDSLHDGGPWTLVDLRPREDRSLPFPYPWPCLEAEPAAGDATETRFLVLCPRGIRSADAARRMRRLGLQAWSLAHGEAGLRRGLRE